MFASGASLKEEPGLLKTEPAAADESEYEFKEEDVVVHEYKESPGNLSETIIGMKEGGLPEQWSVSAWKDTGWWFTFTLFQNNNGSTFTSSMFNQQKGPGRSEGDMYFVADMNEDGVVDRRMLMFDNPKDEVSYVDLDMDGILDTMSISNENKSESASHILLNNTWTLVKEMDLKKGTSTLTVGDSETTAAFIDAKWVLEGSD